MKPAAEFSALPECFAIVSVGCQELTGASLQGRLALITSTSVDVACWLGASECGGALSAAAGRYCASYTSSCMQPLCFQVGGFCSVLHASS